MKGEVRAAKRASFGKILRKGLADITNSSLGANKISSEYTEPLKLSSEITDDYVQKLIQENRTLMKLMEERNKIIELSGAELQRLRISYQKTQLQNWNLAQSNSQMLAEINLARDKLKALRHELACKDALLKAKKLEVEGKLAEKHAAKNASMEVETRERVVEAEEEEEEVKDKQKPPSRIRRHHQRSQSMSGVPSTTTNKQESEKEKEKGENKRRCLRRQSARFVSQDKEPAENLFEIEEAKFSISQPLKSPSAEKDKETDARSSADGVVSQRRSSISRPTRRAAEKVQTYKEPRVNIKMRRPE